MVVAAGKGSDRVDGRLRPGKEVNRTLTIGEEDMLDFLSVRRCLQSLLAYCRRYLN